MSTETVVKLLTALIVILVAALEVQIIKLNRKLDALTRNGTDK